LPRSQRNSWERGNICRISKSCAGPLHRGHEFVENRIDDEHFFFGDTEQIVVVGGAGDDADGGKYYLSILAQLASCPGMKLYRLRPDYITREERVMQLFLTLVPNTPKELRLPRLLQTSSLLFHSLSYLASIVDKRKNSRRLCQVFTDNLVDAIVAIVAVEPSRTTQRALAEVG